MAISDYFVGTAPRQRLFEIRRYFDVNFNLLYVCQCIQQKAFSFPSSSWRSFGPNSADYVGSLRVPTQFFLSVPAVSALVTSFSGDWLEDDVIDENDAACYALLAKKKDHDTLSMLTCRYNVATEQPGLSDTAEKLLFMLSYTVAGYL